MQGSEIPRFCGRSPHRRYDPMRDSNRQIAGGQSEPNDTPEWNCSRRKELFVCEVVGSVKVEYSIPPLGEKPLEHQVKQNFSR